MFAPEDINSSVRARPIPWDAPVTIAHPSIIAVRVFAVPHPFFGNVIRAEVECTPSLSMKEEELLTWLKPQLSRAEMPHGITFQNIGMLSTGKQKAWKT